MDSESILPRRWLRGDPCSGAPQQLRAGGYNGSTYTLEYDPASDTLRGVYFQAVAKQKFDFVFARAR